MDYNILKHFCKTQIRLTNCCCIIYKGDTLIETIGFDNSQMIDERATRHFYNKLIETKTATNMLIQDNHFFIGLVKDAVSDYSVILGPVRFGETTEADINEIITKHKLPKTMLDTLLEFSMHLPIYDLSQFFSLISMFNTFINQNIVSHRNIARDLDIDIDMSMVNNIHKKTISSVNKVREGSTQRHISYEYERALNYYIKNGLVDYLDSLQYNDYGGRVGKLAPTSLRSLKNALLNLNTLCIRAAIEGGLDYETAYTVGELYAQQIENCNTIDNFSRLSTTLRKDYCARVNAIKNKKIENPLIIKATKYINENTYKKITAQEIAKMLKISQSYLSLKFKEALNCSVPEYINKQKIIEAKRLLRFTDNSLVDISTLLSFSSQSYFQNQFKKYRGVTPLEYRQMYRK